MQQRFLKSSYSVGQNNCVEVGGTPIFFKSSYSGGNGACVEVASPESDAILIADSKQPEGARTLLTVAPSAFAAFTDSLKA